MIEVEKKFLFEGGFSERVKREGTFISQEEFKDTYYDTPQWHYTLKNIWLRKRGDAFELKVAMQQESGVIDRYDEITAPLGILTAMKLPLTLPLEKTLEKSHITPFCSFWTHRTKYQLGEFIIDIDTATFKDLTYSVAEVELLVEKEVDIAAAEEKIAKLLERESIDWRMHVLGKLSYYLSQRRPKHYAALVRAKVIRE